MDPGVKGNTTITDDNQFTLTKSVLMGETDGGVYKNVPVSIEGHIETSIHEPRLPFGSIHVESLTPIFQTDAVYGINPSEIIATTGHLTGGTTSASNSGANNLFTCSTGTTALSFASIQSRKRLRYRPGQGVLGRFTALFSTPAASSILVAGYGTSESGYFFGYNGTDFGILYSTGGVREIQTLTVTTASTATDDYVVTLGGIEFTVTATNNGSTVKTAYEIAQGDYDGWTAEQRGSTVVFLANSVGSKTADFTLEQTGAGTPAAGSFVETLAGSAATDTWVTQENWNGDVCDGSGSANNPSGFTLDQSKGNVFQIGIQYLGFGSVSFQIEVVSDNTNNPTFITVHTLKFPNTRTAVSSSQPSFPFTMSAYSAGSTTDVSVSAASFTGMIEGGQYFTGPQITYQRETSGFVGSTASTYYPLFTVRNDFLYGNESVERPNQSIIQLLGMSVSHDDATPITFLLIRNASLAGTPNFTEYSTNSVAYWDVAATTCTFSTNDQLIYSANTGQNSSVTLDFANPIPLQPGETVTLAARAVTGTATYVNGSLNTREDQ